ncbi:unnamed protein product [Alternaria alternata]
MTRPPPPTPALSRGKRARRASSSHANDDARSTASAEGGETHVSASVGSNEDLDFVQEDILRTEDADNTGYMGRNSQVQWLRALETKIEHPERESSDLPYGPPGAEGDAFNQRAKALRGRQQHGDNRQSPHNDQFLGYYFYLDKSNIDIDIGDPHVIPFADTAIVFSSSDILMDKILSGLYSAQKSAKSWKAAQKEIASLSDELGTWALHSLSRGPAAATAGATGHDLNPEQLLLYLYYHSAKICITRPCLCRLDLRIKGQSEESIRFNQKTAEACIGAALDITSTLRDPPNPVWYYENGPWWCAVHMIMQALTVLLLELSLDGIHLTVEKSHVTSCVDKLIRWLSAMKSVDAISESAYNIVARVLNKQSKQEAAHRQLPQPQPTDQHQQQRQAQDTTLELQQQYQSYSQPLALQQSGVVWPTTDAFNSNDFYSQSNTGNFYSNNVSGSEYLNDPNAELMDFDEPLNMFYGNPYEATFDQWEWDPAAFENPDLGQQRGPSGDQGGYQGYGGS